MVNNELIIGNDVVYQNSNGEGVIATDLYADGDYFTLLGFFFGGVGDDDTACSFLFGFCGLNDHAVGQRFNC